MLRSSSYLRGWWLARDANEALLASHPTCCLAYYVGMAPEALAEALSALKLFGKGVRIALRRCSVTNKPLGVARVNSHATPPELCRPYIEKSAVKKCVFCG